MQLFYFPASIPCRSILLFLHTINLQADLQVMNLMKGDHMAPEYLALNPQHTIPLLVDDGFVLSESRAILGYLAEKYANDSAYYPSDPMARAVVNQRLMFDIGTLFQQIMNTYMYPIFAGEDKINEMTYPNILEALGWLNTFIEDSLYMAGDKMTIADFSIVVSISLLDQLGVDLSPYPKVEMWYMRCKKEMKDFEEINKMGSTMIIDMLKEELGLVVA